VQVLQQPNKTTEYLEAVRQQIRWKRAQSHVLEEINNHITDQKNAFVSEGLNEEAATDKAITEMGDPIVVGEQLDRAHRPKPDWPLLVITATMLLLGLAIQFFVGPNIFNGAGMFEKQIVWAGIAILVMFAAYFVDFTIIGKYPKVVFFALCAITIACNLFTGRVKGQSIYTIYLLLLFPTAFAGFVYRMRNKGYSGLILCGAAFIIPASLSWIVPSVTVLFLLCASCLIILTAAVEKGWFNVRKLFAMLIMYIPTAAVLSTPFFMMRGEEYVSHRMQVMLNPSLDPTGYGYIGTVIQRFLSHSQFIGEGLPLSGYGEYAASQLLPAANTDFLLTYLIYRFGWIVLIGIIAIFSAFIMRAIILSKKQKSVLGFLVSLAIISTFAVQCTVYIASNLGFMLLSPLSLPLISYGGRALVTNMCLIGFLLSVYRTGNLVRDKAGVAVAKSSRFIQYDNGQIIIDLKNNSIK
jgi:cell division protein FtsW (lipid II flippase)